MEGEAWSGNTVGLCKCMAVIPTAFPLHPSLRGRGVPGMTVGNAIQEGARMFFMEEFVQSLTVECRFQSHC